MGTKYLGKSSTKLFGNMTNISLLLEEKCKQTFGSKNLYTSLAVANEVIKLTKRHTAPHLFDGCSGKNYIWNSTKISFCQILSVANLVYKSGCSTIRWTFSWFQITPYHFCEVHFLDFYLNSVRIWAIQNNWHTKLFSIANYKKW